MNFLKWHQVFSVGEPKLDDQHRRLFAYLNDLHAALQDGRISDQQLEILDNLVIYTRYHCASEENCLKRVDYIHLAEHKQIHADLVARLMARQKAIVTGRTEDFLEFLTWFRSETVNHLSHEDQKYASHLATHRSPELVSIP